MIYAYNKIFFKFIINPYSLNFELTIFSLLLEKSIPNIIIKFS